MSLKYSFIYFSPSCLKHFTVFTRVFYQIWEYSNSLFQSAWISHIIFILFSKKVKITLQRGWIKNYILSLHKGISKYSLKASLFKEITLTTFVLYVKRLNRTKALFLWNFELHCESKFRGYLTNVTQKYRECIMYIVAWYNHCLSLIVLCKNE